MPPMSSQLFGVMIGLSQPGLCSSAAVAVGAVVVANPQRLAHLLSTSCCMELHRLLSRACPAL
jgi:homoserine kinase